MRKDNFVVDIATSKASRFDNYHKIAVRDHVRVPKFWHTNIRGQIQKSIYEASYLLPCDFSKNFSKARSYLNRMKNC